MASVSLEQDKNGTTLHLPSVVHSQNKNEYVIALQAEWSPQSFKEADPNSFHDGNSPPSGKSEEEDDPNQRMLTDDCVDPVTGVSNAVYLLAQDSVKTMDMDDTAFDQSTEGTHHLPHQDPYGTYNEIEELLYGMNKRMINHDEAIVLARKNPQDPILLAFQALLKENNPESKKLWIEAKQLGLESIAKGGHGLAQALAGRMTECTVGGVHFFAESWYEQGAEQNNATAQYFLGKSYEESRDFETAQLWYEKAASRGHSAAQTRLGRLAAKGLFGLQPRDDEATAKYWLTQAASQGDTEGQVNLAFLFYKEQNRKSARYWYEKASVAGRQESTIKELDKGLEKYLYDKAQSNLNQLFVHDDTITDNDKNQEIFEQKIKTKITGGASDLLTKMRSAGLQWITESSDTPYPPACSATMNSKSRGFTATATSTSIMSLQSLSIGSIHTMSVASTDSFRQATALLRFESEGGQESTASLSRKGTDIFFHTSTHQLEDLLSLEDSFTEGESSLQIGSDSTTTQSNEGRDSLPRRTNVTGVSDMEVDDIGATTKLLPCGLANGSSISKTLSDYSTLPADVIKPFHAVLGDRSARGPRLTVGTKELRNAKDWFRKNRPCYQREGRQSELFDHAMERYYARMSELFDDFPADTSSREKTILIHCSKHVQDSCRVQNPNCFRHINDKEHQYGTAIFPDAILFYFNNRDPPKLDDQVAKYRRKLQSTAQLKGERREYFEKYLEFCEMTVAKAAEGSPAAQLAAEKNNFIPTLKALWDDIEKELQNKEQAV